MLLPAERHRAISQLVNSKGSIRVKELSQIFDVTEETVRRDLDILEGEGVLRRSHGGAIRILDEPTETSYLQREEQNVSEKQSFAREAITYIEPGDRIVLDASTTAWNIALALPNMPLTVLTNSIKVALELSARDKVDVISSGGILHPRSLSYVGPLAEAALSKFHVNKAFLSCKGLHSEYGLSESNALQALVKRKMLDISDKVFLLVDHSKMQVRDFTSFAQLHEVDVLITDHKTTNEQLTALKAGHVKVIAV